MVLLGLWPPHFDGSSIETWQDVLRLRREIRGIFRRFCLQVNADYSDFAASANSEKPT
jgi:hypothetical protein